MSAARKPASRPRGLVLVRGGLEARNGDGDDDWEDFCRRIGWQTASPAPDTDFEKRIAEGIFTKPIAPDNVIDLELAREIRQPGSPHLDPSFAQEIRRSFVREIQISFEEEAPISGCRAAGRAADRFEDAAEAELAPDGDTDRSRRGWVRVGAAAVTLTLAATVLLAVTRLAFSSGRSASASIVAPSAEVMHASTARPRVDAPPPEVAPVRVAPPEGPTAKPAPNAPRLQPKAPRDTRPVPPGALVARRSLDAPTPDHTLAPDRPDSRDADLAMKEASPVDSIEAPESEARPAVASLAAFGADPRAAWPGARTQADPAASWAASVRSRIALSGAESAAPVKGSAAPDVWSSGVSAADPPAAERARAANASWSLSGAKDRWVGASLTPSPTSLAQANIGVMVQLDVGKALGKL